MLILFFAFGLAFTTDTVYDNNWALVVGINIYQNAPDLSYAVEDALAIKNMLINQHGFPRKNVRYLIDQDATQSNIKKQLSNITKAAGENDRVVFYFAGHGETQPLGLEEGDVGFLLPFDGDADDLYFSAIDMGELTRISNYSKAKHMLFLVDACYGGLAAMNTRSIKTNTPNYLDKVIQENARQIITAGGKDEEVLEKDDWKHSAFTKNILSGLEEKKADSDEDGFITGSELGSYLQRTVSIDTDNFQTPQVKRLTTHGGEIIFHSKLDKKDKENLNAEEMFDKFLEKLDQKYQNNQFQIDENQRVVKPGSMGLYKINPTLKVKIIRVFYQPSGLMYEVKFKPSIGTDDEWTQSTIIKIDEVLEIPGVTKYGIYNLTAGTVD
jgi:uncharacterized caspase-like protein|tara:strand:+ start:47 stop:1195 length:1149 start_codon:yes stop_codon:yes gene_type:complete